MAIVKTFRISPGVGLGLGVPDQDIRDFLNTCEQNTIINVCATFIPSLGTADPRLCVIVTKLDELHQKDKE